MYAKTHLPTSPKKGHRKYKPERDYIENYDRKKETAIAILKQRAHPLYGLPIDRFIRACGIPWSRRLRPTAKRRNWTKIVFRFIRALEKEQLIYVQRTFPLIHCEPERVYLYGTQPPFQLLHRYSTQKQKERPRQNKKLHPLKIRSLHPFQVRAKAKLLELLEPGEKGQLLIDIDLLLAEHGHRLASPNLQEVLNHLAAIGVLHRESLGRKVLYRMISPEEKVFEPGDKVVILPGKPSEKFGIVESAKPHPVHPVTVLTVRLPDGSREMSSSELAYKVVAVNSEEVLAA